MIAPIVRNSKIWSVIRVSSGNFLEMYDFMVFGYYATAIGNAVSGYACNQCSGNMSANNSQSNNVDVSARSTVSVTNSGRSITGIATATGNNATFSVTGR